VLCFRDGKHASINLMYHLLLPEQLGLITARPPSAEPLATGDEGDNLARDSHSLGTGRPAHGD
jgi:hypothetical protein